MTTTVTNPSKIFEIKAVLAKLLATENIGVRHDPQITTAAFDIQNRQLFLPVWNNISNDLYDMLVVHETGHALYTNMDAWTKAIDDIANRCNPKNAKAAKPSVKSFLNVVEDARIDKLQKRKFPGSKRNYVQGHKELFARDFFKLKETGKNVNDLPFIDRANIYFKGGDINLNITFTPEEKALIARMERLETFDEVAALTEEIYKQAKFKMVYTSSDDISAEEMNGEEGEEGGEDFEFVSSDEDDEGNDSDSIEVKSDKSSDEGDEGDEGNSSSKGNSSDDEQSEEDEEETNSKGKFDKEKNNKNNKENDDEKEVSNEISDILPQAGGKGNTKFEFDDVIPECQTEVVFEEAMKNLASGNGNLEYHYISFPEVNVDKIVDDFSVTVPAMSSEIERVFTYRKNHGRSPTKEGVTSQFNNWKLREKDNINYMIKEFEMRKAADTHSRTSISKTGVIDTNKLPSYKFNDDIFRKLTVVPQGKNHGFIMLLDWSSSMAGNLRGTVKQLLSLVMFCKKMNIPFEVYIFRCPLTSEVPNYQSTYAFGYRNHGSAIQINDQFTVKGDSLYFDPLKLRNVLSSRMNLPMFNQAMFNMWAATFMSLTTDPMDSTPLNQAILAFEPLVNQFRKKNRLQIVNTIILSDGGSDPSNVYFSNGKTVSDLFKGPKKKVTFVLTDEKTKKTYNLEDGPYLWYWNCTKMLLQVLKDRTGCNLVGFYLHGSTLGGHIPGVEGDQMYNPKNVECWRKNMFVSIADSGYDEYFILNSTAFVDNTEASQLRVDPKMTKTRVVKEFIKFFDKKAVNRILLGRFIDRIAADRKQ